MALNLKITDAKGITTKYHKIAALQITDRITVTLKTYADESYRDKEKQIQENVKLKEELEKRIIDEQVKEEPDEGVIQTLNIQLAALDTTPADYSVGSMTYKLPFNTEDEISFRGIYEALKKEASFSDAEDC